MLHAIIIDDELLGILTLKKMLESHSESITIIAETADPAEGITMINRFRPDVVFLDIQMPQFSGFELLDQVKNLDFYLIFTTAHINYALQALKLNAFDYLLKPIAKEDLSATIARIKKLENKSYNAALLIETLKKQNEKSATKIMLPTRDEVSYVTANELMYLEAQSNNCKVKL
ncbi:MAG: LytR/AlgR family response regulator transcription factor, partial [Bacteroidia bacterium]